MERQYIGARYVPKFFENPNTGDTTWLPGVAYEALTIVSYAGNSYTSKKPVPAGIGSPNTNTEYWASTGIFNAQVEQIRQEISAVSGRTDALEDSVEELESSVNASIENIEEDVAKIAHRIKGKTVAIYGDSWSTQNYGAPWINYLAEQAGSAPHVRAQGSLALPGVYGLWDDFVADIYIIQAGLNDSSLGTKGDAFGTALNNFINSIKAVNTNAEIYFLTPPNISSTSQLNYLFPFEFYRTYVWRRAPLLGFNVINGLKITDIKYSDGVHPTAATAVNIGKHIVAAIDTFGDEETHTTEFTNMGRGNNKLLFMMKQGIPYIRFQNFDEQASAAGTGVWNGMWVASVNLADLMGLSCQPSYNNFAYPGGNGVALNLIYAFSSYNANGLYLAWSVNSHTVLAPAEVELNISAWQRPMT